MGIRHSSHQKTTLSTSSEVCSPQIGQTLLSVSLLHFEQYNLRSVPNQDRWKSTSSGNCSRGCSAYEVCENKSGDLFKNKIISLSFSAPNAAQYAVFDEVDQSLGNRDEIGVLIWLDQRNVWLESYRGNDQLYLPFSMIRTAVASMRST